MNNIKGITLYAHQNKMVGVANLNNKGIFVAPTGSGKTLTQAEIVAKEINSGGFKVIVVKTPRISLSNQLATEYSEYFFTNHNLNKGKEFNSTLLHSGKADEAPDDFDAESPIQLARFFKQFAAAESDRTAVSNLIADAKEKDIPFVMFTTYHSNEKAWQIISDHTETVALDINDEGHFLTQACFSEIFSMYTPVRQYFFTATLRLRESEEGNGMNNTSRFGEIIYSMSIAYAIKEKLIIPIKPHYVEAAGDVDRLTELKSIAEFVRVSFDHLTETTELTPKMLIAVQGATQIETFTQSATYQEMLDEGVHILTVHSTKEFNTYNGEQITRKQFNDLKNKLGKDASVKLIMMHYDILSEGIDIPGLTGVMILRNMELSKFLQTIGRVIRIYRNNPELKTFGMLYFPNLSDKDLKTRFDTMLAEIYTEGYVPEEYMNELIAAGKEEGEEVEAWQEEATGRNSQLLDLMVKDLDLTSIFGETFTATA